MQVAVAECQQSGKHPSLVTLGSFPLQIHFPLCCDNGLDIIGLLQSLHFHIIIHAQKNVFQVGTGKPVLGYFSNAAVFHICSEDALQGGSNLGFAFTAVAFNDHHPLALVAGNQAVANKLLECRNVLRVQQIIQKVKPPVRLRGIWAVDDGQPVTDNLRPSLCESAI